MRRRQRLVVGERRCGEREELPLLAVGADQQVDAGGGALGDTAEGIGGHGVTVRHGTEREERQRDAGTGEDSLGVADAFGGHRRVGGEQRGGLGGPQRGHVVEADLAEELPGVGARLLGCAAGLRGA